MSKPSFPDDSAFKSLRCGEVEEFHQLIKGRDVVDFSGTDLRGTDFRSVDLRKVLLHDAYLRDANLSGCDLRQMDLTGASLHGARIGGTYFQENLTAQEIMMSVQHGTRLRTTIA